MKRILLSLVCCLPLLFNTSIIQGLEIIGPDEPEIQILTEDQYGPIQETETLWRVSTVVRPDNSVSIYQTLIAIYKSNPDAFFEGDINKIISGSIINIPSKEFIEQQTDQEALALLSPSQSTTTNTAAVTPSSSTRSATAANPVVTKVTPKAVVKSPATTPAVVKVEDKKPVTKAVETKPVTEIAKAPEVKTDDKVEKTPIAEPAIPLEEKIVKVVEKTITNDEKTQAMETALEKARKLIAEQEAELILLNEQLLNVTEMNQRLKLKIQPLADQITLLSEQIKEEENLQIELQGLIDQYREQIESFDKPPFSGDGFINELLQRSPGRG